MNSSNVGDGASGFPSSIENKSDFSFNSPPISRSGLEKAALGTAPASGLSRLPRLVKPRRQMGSHHPRSAAVPETRVNPGFNPFRPVSEDSNAASSGLETSDKNEAFASAASGSNLGTNSVKWGSAGILDKEVVDDMRKLKIGSEKGIVDAGYGVSANLNEPEGSFGMGRKVSSTLEESGASELPDGMRKLNIGGSGNSERGEKSKDGNIYLSTNDKTRFGFGSGDNVGSSVGKSVESELPKEFMKLNVKDAAVLDDGSLISNADDRKKFVSGSSKKGSDYFTGSSASMLPDQMRNLNLKDSVNAQNVDKNEVNSMASEKTSFVFGSSRSTATDSLGERTETVLSNKMGNMKIGSGTGDSSGRTDTGFSSPQIFVKETQTQDLGDKMFYDVGKSIPMEFTFQTGMPGKDASDSQVPIERPNDDFKLNGTTASSSAFSSTGIHFGGKVFEVPSMDRSEKKDEFSFTSKQDGRGTTHVDFKTPNRTENLLSGLNHKVEFSAKREAVKDTRSKKRRGKFRKPDLVQVWFGHDFVPKESSSQENPVSPVSYSPMDVSPYQETLADNQCSRETSVTSNDSFHLDINYASTDSHPTVSYDATDEDLVSATRHLDISEGDEKCDEMKEETSEYHFNKGVGAEGHPEESISGAETESFKSATEEVDANDDVTVTSAVTEAGLNIEKQESDGRMHFFSASSSEDINGTNFTFAASSSPQGQASATARHHRMKARTKVGPDSYNHTPNAKVPYASHSPQFFPFSRTASFSSRGQSKKGDLPTSQQQIRE
ncbi:hypothetical protein L1049_018644 [Liquidambar formosana]|uniref:Uncharacterized protein n=1 Tax=Liquidambar formosana TaxID=63359 RepID=A0AAP0WMC0_LIQFO